ncbi:hypothetical protein HGG70_00485 [Rhodobacteraceae bacterium R_SAG4]|nr:hypothetical protein [Rhodobacteraceae bacterium R_SAG4]
MRVLISVLVVFLCLNAPLAMARNFIAASDGSNNTVNQRTTRDVVRTLEHEVGLCLQLFDAYRFDCIVKSYNIAARLIKGSIDYLPAYEALNSVEQRVGAMVAANADPTATRLRRGIMSYGAIKPGTLEAVKRETLRAMEEARASLLRATGPLQKPHFQDIADAIGANYAMIRAALAAQHQGAPLIPSLAECRDHIIHHRLKTAAQRI